MTRSGLASILLLVLGACRSAPPTLHDVYRDTLADLAGGAGVSQESRRRNAQRHADVRARIAAGEVKTALDFLYAAGVLCTSDEMQDLELARQLATTSSELGEARGRVLVAEATDKILLQMGGRQHYGTQVYLNMATRRWELYPFDPGVSDEVRAYMGLPSLAQMLQRVEQLNEQGELGESVLHTIEAE